MNTRILKEKVGAGYLRQALEKTDYFTKGEIDWIIHRVLYDRRRKRM